LDILFPPMHLNASNEHGSPAMTYIDRLDAEWEDEGFLGKLRRGIFAAEEAARFLKFQGGIEIPEGTMVPKRAISLFWYLPGFLLWQRERIAERGGNLETFDRFVTDVHNTLEAVLGVP
jgi:hypothetical protein